MQEKNVFLYMEVITAITGGALAPMVPTPMTEISKN